MQGGPRGSGVLGWAAVAVPGIFASLGFAFTAGWPLVNRVLVGVAAGLVVYAALHWLLDGRPRNKG